MKHSLVWYGLQIVTWNTDTIQNNTFRFIPPTLHFGEVLWKQSERLTQDTPRVTECSQQDSSSLRPNLGYQPVDLLYSVWNLL